MDSVYPAFLTNPELQIILFGGKGGVGKTSCATATALYKSLVTPTATFLLVSTDPAHSLLDSLAGMIPPPNLQVLELDAATCLSTFKAQHHHKLREIAARGTFLDDEDINQLTDLSLPGLDELMAFLEIADWVKQRRYDCIIVDTAPTGHTLRLLQIPVLLRKWLKALDALLAKHRYLKKTLTGKVQPDALDHFLEIFAIAINQLERLLQNTQRCRFVPVMLAEILSVQETQRLLNELQQLHIPVSDIVVNKVFPAHAAAVYGQQQRVLNQWLLEKVPSLVVWQVPIYAIEICGYEALHIFWQSITAIRELANIPPEPAVMSQVIAPALLPSSAIKLGLFAGKGGVGKTTLACATALRLAYEQPEKSVLLFSIDPAHSLSDCLDLSVTSQPTLIFPGLWAIEMNPENEFNALKQQYATEVQAFFQSLSRHIDLPFDRAVMEGLMDLSPPGLDEVIALSTAMDCIAQKQYDTVIIDTAPTGHLIRFLELPHIVDQWLKLLFEFFLKYKQLFRLPTVSQKLVVLSKQLKLLRSLLCDSQQSALYTVTILETMALKETQDLIVVCEHMQMNVPVIFCNLVTPFDNDSPLYVALQQRESVIKEELLSYFPHKQHTFVYRRGSPRGIEQLLQLGKNLYK